jgi:hypothetical protein
LKLGKGLFSGDGRNEICKDILQNVLHETSKGASLSLLILNVLKYINNKIKSVNISRIELKKSIEK